MFKNKTSVMRAGARFMCAGAAYNALELIWRGFTHVSMFLLGGICFCVIARIAKSRRCFLVKSFLSAAMITFAEGTAGCVLNIWLGLNVWDYSDEKLHLMGQVCPRFFLLWWMLSAAVLPLCKIIERWEGLSSFKAARQNAKQVLRADKDEVHGEALLP